MCSGGTGGSFFSRGSVASRSLSGIIMLVTGCETDVVPGSKSTFSGEADVGIGGAGKFGGGIE